MVWYIGQNEAESRGASRATLIPDWLTAFANSAGREELAEQRGSSLQDDPGRAVFSMPQSFHTASTITGANSMLRSSEDAAACGIASQARPQFFKYDSRLSHG